MDRRDGRRVVRKRAVKRKPRRRILWKRVFLLLAIVAGILWGIGAACSWAYHAIFDSPETVEVSEPPAEEETVEVAPPVRSTPAWSTRALPSAVADEKLAASRKTLNVLFIGADDVKDGNYYGEADSIMLLVVNTEDDTASMVSIPSNTRIPVAGQETVTLREVYKQGGTPLTLKLVEEYLGITIPYYAAVDHAVFTRIVDELGGVNLYVEEKMAYTDSYDGYVINLAQGYQTLDGERAQQYIRYVSGELGDVGRMKRQERFVKAMVEQHASLGSIFDIPSILSILEDESDSNLTFYPLMKIAGVLREYQPSMTLGELLPGKAAVDAQGSYWETDQAGVDALFGRIFKLTLPQAEEPAAPPPPVPPTPPATKPTEVKDEASGEVDSADTPDKPQTPETTEETENQDAQKWQVTVAMIENYNG